MKFKSSLTPLNQLELLDPSILELLRKSGITTLEEFVGNLEADPEGTRELLNFNESEFEDLKKKAMSLLDPTIREAFERQKGRKYPLGVLDPNLKGRKS